MKNILITGASSGIGKEVSIYFAKQGWKVAATMRNPQGDLANIENISEYKLDVTNNTQVQETITQVINDFKTVDVVLNNAGYGLFGSFEAATEEQIRTQMETNLFGVMNVTRAFLPYFRSNQQGMFINVSSIGGRVTFPLMSLYLTTKWALEGFSESIVYELKEYNIQVKIIEPGIVATDFSGRMVYAHNENLNAYQKTAEKFQQNVTNLFNAPSTTDKIADTIYKAATDNKNQLRYLVGDDAQQIFGIRQSLGDDGFIADVIQKTLT